MSVRCANDLSLLECNDARTVPALGHTALRAVSDDGHVGTSWSSVESTASTPDDVAVSDGGHVGTSWSSVESTASTPAVAISISPIGAAPTAAIVADATESTASTPAAPTAAIVADATVAGQCAPAVLRAVVAAE